MPHRIRETTTGYVLSKQEIEKQSCYIGNYSIIIVLLLTSGSVCSRSNRSDEVVMFPFLDSTTILTLVWSHCASRRSSTIPTSIS
ncbi:hypothetical protein ScPMuIL_011762 [Solemya velum]